MISLPATLHHYWKSNPKDHPAGNKVRNKNVIYPLPSRASKKQVTINWQLRDREGRTHHSSNIDPESRGAHPPSFLSTLEK